MNPNDERCLNRYDGVITLISEPQDQSDTSLPQLGPRRSLLQDSESLNPRAILSNKQTDNTRTMLDDICALMPSTNDNYI